jgi:hypothetical protein
MIRADANVIIIVTFLRIRVRGHGEGGWTSGASFAIESFYAVYKPKDMKGGDA